MGEAPHTRPSSESPDEDCRCHCGALLARVRNGEIELKCRRCRRTLLLRADPAASTWVRLSRD